MRRSPGGLPARHRRGGDADRPDRDARPGRPQARLRRPRGNMGHRGEGLPGRRDNGRPRQESARRDRSSLGRTTGTVGRRLSGEGGKKMAADFRKQMGPFITARREPKVVRLPALKYVMIAGRGDPAKGREVQEAVQALYALVYPLKFSSKPGSRQRAMPVLPLDALWWMPGRKGFPANAPRSAWRWQAMLAVP